GPRPKPPPPPWAPPPPPPRANASAVNPALRAAAVAKTIMVLRSITLTPSNAVRVRSIKDHPLRPRGSLRPKSYCDVQLFQVDVQYAAGDKRKTAQIDAIKVDSYG